jgi:alpha-ketoglutarate-dependent taurine dioxygenase
MALYSTIEFSEFQGDLLISRIKDLLASSGVVVVNNVHLDPAQLLELSTQLGSRVDLPDFLHPGQVDGFKNISRVANFTQNADNERSFSDKPFGNYWHHDGDFWPTNQNHIINMLYSVEVPERGGNTAFLNTRVAYNALTEAQRTLLADVTVPVSTDCIEDYIGNDADANCGDSIHCIVQELPSGRSLYLPKFNGTVRLGDGSEATHEDLFPLVEQAAFRYEHHWHPNQLILWDNLMCLHRAMGQVEGYRLLWRCQVRI